MVFPPIWGEKWRRSEHAHASYPGLFFARPGSAPIWGGKKGEFRDWTIGGLDHIVEQSITKRRAKIVGVNGSQTISSSVALRKQGPSQKEVENNSKQLTYSLHL